MWFPTSDGSRREWHTAEDGWFAPEGVELDADADRLIFPRTGRRLVRASAGMLEGFGKLAEAPSARIRDYARRWGALEICEHGLPATHNQLRSDPDSGEIATWGCVPLPVGQGWDLVWEPVAVWRQFARQARAIHNLKDWLDGGTLGRSEDWWAIPDAGQVAAVLVHVKGGDDDLLLSGAWRDWRVLLERSPLGRDVAFEQEVLGKVADGWLRLGGVRPSFSWRAGRPQIVLTGGGLFGALATQLVFAVGRADGLAICSECGDPYIPSRRPAASRRNFCTDCGRDAAVRAAARSYRQRKRVQKRGQKEGPSHDE